MPTSSVLAAAILLGSLVLLLLRPRRVPDWAAALGGGLLLVLVGVLPLGDALGQLAGSWNVFLFFWGWACQPRRPIAPVFSARRLRRQRAWAAAVSDVCS